MDQTIVNWVFGFLSMILGILLRAMWTAVRDLQSADKQVLEKVNSIEVLVAGGYVKKDEFDRHTTALFDKLDRIEDKLDKKADKK
tara:strand:- start:25202 stop:25456 length:255 start_codon:yes stop_codon:yes gene_type:complete